MTLQPKLRNRMIFKVLVLGRNQGLKNGFLTMASGECISCQLQPALGVSLGISRTNLEEGPEIAFQLWTIPDSDRFEKLMDGFSRGHRGVIVLIEEDDLPHIERVLSILPPESLKSSVFVYLSEAVEGHVLQTLEGVLGSSLLSQSCRSVDEIIRILARDLSGFNRSDSVLPILLTLSHDACPPVFPEPRMREKEPSSQNEIDEIRDVCISMGLRITDEECHLELAEGSIDIEFKHGKILFRPALCNMCTESCKREANICIVCQDPGWSSGGLGKVALLTLAKIIGLARREIPEHVEMQLSRASICSNFMPSPDISQDLISKTINSVRDSQPRQARIPLLQLAQQRVAEGRLTMADYNMLKRKLEQVSRESY